jgi:signal transduction histidine kinase
MRIRNWPIRAKIMVLVVPPLVSLLVLWIFVTNVLLAPALNLFATQTNNDQASLPAAKLVDELQVERKLSLIFLASGRADARAMGDQRTHTDAAAATFRTRATGAKMQSAASELTRQRIREAIAAMDRLPEDRQSIDRGTVDRTAAFDLYNGISDVIFGLFNSSTLLDDQGLARDSRTLTALGRASEVLSREDSLLNGVAAAGKVQAGEPARLTQIIGAQRELFAAAAPELNATDRQAYDQVAKGEPVIRLHALEDKLASDMRVGSLLPIDIGAWHNTYDTVTAQLNVFVLTAADGIVARATPVATGIFLRLGIAAVLGLLTFLGSAALSIRVGRSLIRRLTGLREAAQALADERLPSVVSRLRRGEQVDVAAETPALEYGNDEIGAVGNAFSAVQRTAVESAVHESRLRLGLNEVFLNIARRSQTLLHRQLSLLDRMERRSADPDELEDLFRVDHLTTRMRRHAEDLVILAGAAPGRGWRNPIPMVDVIRGAVSEVEDYARVGFLAIPEASLVGRAVADVIHLLAEIVENATSYSPPHTRVQISGQLVPNGFAIEVEDRGLGMAPEAIDAANQRLRQPPDFDPANSARLGLFVVSLLAARHRIRVTLRPSPYGGITAVVLVPPDLIIGAQSMTPSVAAHAFAPVFELEPADVVRPSHVAPEEPTTMAAAPAVHNENAIPNQRVAMESSTTAPVTRSPVVSGVPPEHARPDADLGARTFTDGTFSDSTFSDSTFSDDAFTDDALTDDGLPRRHRQASLAPQLREVPDEAGTQADPTEPVSVGGRSPEQIREMMSSFQSGLVRGRRDAATVNDPGEPPAQEGTV